MSADRAVTVLGRALAALDYAVVVTDLEGRVSSWNPAAGVLYGCTAAEATGKLACDLVSHGITTLITDHDGHPIATLIVSYDVKARRSLEARADHFSFRAIVDTVQEGIWTAHPVGNTVYADQKLADILGLPLEAISPRR